MSGNVLVTGGAGFIGARLARRCLEAGKRVWIVDDLSTGREANVPKGAELVRLDLGKDGFTDKLPSEKFEAVLHLAAQSSGEISNEDPLRDFRVNLAGTVELLDWAAKRTGRFLYASSMAIYGDPPSLPVTEEMPARPLSYYGVGKAASEQYVLRANREGFATTAFRMFSVYGPGQNMENMKQGMLSIYLAYALKGGLILVKGSKDRFRDFVYIDDVADAWMAAFNAPAAAGRAYNLASGVKTHVWQAVEAVQRATGLDPKQVAYGDPTPADQFGLVADIGRIKAELGWSPRVGLDEGLKKMAVWARGGS